MGDKILVVDDDPAFLRLLEKVLTGKGYEVLKANSGSEGLRFLFEEHPLLVLLDVVMPGLDGWQVCSRIRDISDVPIIMLTGMRMAEEDIVRGLDYGADDYVVKPVGNRELVARVRAALRRAALSASPDIKRAVTYSDGYLTVNIAQRKIMADSQRIRLTPREFRLFSLLLGNAGHILTHRQLLEKVWGWEYTDDVDYVRIYISHLRQKIEPDIALPRYIMTEPGVGYYFQRAEVIPGSGHL
ncbi:MAG: response regulator transcription factor [Dehalococcoidales bacterium]|nr:response regulator transcription factor [Dehalococcoidales bacterium]